MTLLQVFGPLLVEEAQKDEGNILMPYARHLIGKGEVPVIHDGGEVWLVLP